VNYWLPLLPGGGLSSPPANPKDPKEPRRSLMKQSLLQHPLSDQKLSAICLSPPDISQRWRFSVHWSRYTLRCPG
jgi:hypothetical protein